MESRGIKAEVVLVPAVAELPRPDTYELVVSLGSDSCSIGDDPWIPGEKLLLVEAHRRGIPILGICFGSQLLALALGGAVKRDAVAEVGWRRIRSAAPDLIGEGPWFEWHFDVFEIPEGSELLASSDSGPEAFRMGRSLGVQFHPEVDRSMIETWVDGSRSDLDRADVEEEELFEGLGDVLEKRVMELFDSVGRQVGVI